MQSPSALDSWLYFYYGGLNVSQFYMREYILTNRLYVTKSLCTCNKYIIIHIHDIVW